MRCHHMGMLRPVDHYAPKWPLYSGPKPVKPFTLDAADHEVPEDAGTPKVTAGQVPMRSDRITAAFMTAKGRSGPQPGLMLNLLA